jgi:hypothetical protein
MEQPKGVTTGRSGDIGKKRMVRVVACIGALQRERLRT